MKTPYSKLLALDLGEKRVGVARGDTELGIAYAVQTLTNDDKFIPSLKQLIEEEHADAVVVGIPRGQEGQETAQSHIVRAFTEKFIKPLGVPVEFQDESLTSVHAEEYLKEQGNPFQKGDIDMHAARIILQDWLEQHR